MNYELIREVLFISLLSSFLGINITLKLKEWLFIKYYYIFIISYILFCIVIGTLFSLTFSNLNIINSMWVGIFTFIFTDLIYKFLESKIFNKNKAIG